MGNDNQNATVNQGTQDVQTQAQPQPQAQVTDQQVSDQQPQVQEPSNEPTIADLMKELAELKVDNRKLKKANDSLASENGGLRKQVNAKMTEEELRAQQKSEKDEEIANELKSLRNEVALGKATKRYMSMKMPEELAGKVAQAELDGDMDLVTQSIKSFIEAQTKETEERVKKEIYAKMPIPVSGNGDGQVDYEKIYQEKLGEGDLQGAIHAQLMGSQQKAN